MRGVGKEEGYLQKNWEVIEEEFLEEDSETDEEIDSQEKSPILEESVAYNPLSGAVNARSLSQIYEKIQDQVARAKEKLGQFNKDNQFIEKAYAVLKSDLARMNDPHLRLANDPESKMKLLESMRAYTRAIVNIHNEYIEYSESHEDQRDDLIQALLQRMALVSYHMQCIHANQLMLVRAEHIPSRDEFSSSDERFKKLGLNETKGHWHSVGLAGGVNGLQNYNTGVWGANLLGNIGANWYCRYFVDPNGPTVKLEGWGGWLGCRGGTTRNLSSDPEDGSGYPWRGLDAGSGFNATVGVTHESLTGLMSGQSEYNQHLSSRRNVCSFKEQELLRKIKAERNDWLWKVRNYWASVTSEDLELKQRVAKKQLEDDSINANQGDTQENCFSRTIKKICNKTQEWLGVPTGEATVIDKTPLSSLESAKGGHPQGFLDFVKSDPWMKSMGLRPLVMEIQKAYQGLEAGWREDEGLHSLFNGYITTGYGTGVVNINPNMGESWMWRLPGETTGPVFNALNISLAGQVGYENSKWLYDFDQPPSDFLNPNVNMNAEGTLASIRKETPHLLALRDKVRDRYVQVGEHQIEHFEVEKYLKFLARRRVVFDTEGAKLREAYAKYLETKKDASGFSKSMLKIYESKVMETAHVLADKFLPGQLDDDQIHVLAFQHHEEFMAMLWAALSLATAFYPPEKKEDEKKPEKNPREMFTPMRREEKQDLKQNIPEDIEQEELLSDPDLTVRNQDRGVQFNSERSQDDLEDVTSQQGFKRRDLLSIVQPGHEAVQSEFGERRGQSYGRPPFKIAPWDSESVKKLNELRSHINLPKINMQLESLYRKSPWKLQVRGLSTQSATFKGSFVMTNNMVARESNSSVQPNSRTSVAAEGIRVDFQVGWTGITGHHDASRNGNIANVRLNIGSTSPIVRELALNAFRSWLESESENWRRVIPERADMITALLRNWPTNFGVGGEFRMPERMTTESNQDVENRNYSNVMLNTGYSNGVEVSWTGFQVDPIKMSIPKPVRESTEEREQESEREVVRELITFNPKTEYKLQSLSVLRKAENTGSVNANLSVLQLNGSGGYNYASRSSIADITYLGPEPTIHIAQYSLCFNEQTRKLEERVAALNRNAEEARRWVMPEQRTSLFSTSPKDNPEHWQTLQKLHEQYLHDNGRHFADIIEQGLEARADARSWQENKINGFVNLRSLASSKLHWNKFLKEEEHEYVTAADIEQFREDMRELGKESKSREQQLYYLFQNPLGKKMLRSYRKLIETGLAMRTSSRFGTEDEAGGCTVRTNPYVITKLSDLGEEVKSYRLAKHAERGGREAEMRSQQGRRFDESLPSTQWHLGQRYQYSGDIESFQQLPSTRRLNPLLLKKRSDQMDELE